MGTMVDYAYRFEGGANDIEKACAAIKAFQVENAAASGNGDHDFGVKPEIGDDGAMNWTCYTTRGMDDFDDAIVALTAQSDLRCLAYWGCTDGDNSGGLNLFEGGAADGIGEWGAEIGLDAALAMRKLSEAASVEALLTLVDSLEVAVKDGWDEDDFPWLLRAAVVAGAMAEALAAHAGLLQDKAVGKALLSMRPALEEVRKDLNLFHGPGTTELEGVGRLLSMIERMEIGAAAGPAPRRGRLLPDL